MSQQLRNKIDVLLNINPKLMPFLSEERRIKEMVQHLESDKVLVFVSLSSLEKQGLVTSKYKIIREATAIKKGQAERVFVATDEGTKLNSMLTDFLESLNSGNVMEK